MLCNDLTLPFRQVKRFFFFFYFYLSGLFAMVFQFAVSTKSARLKRNE